VTTGSTLAQVCLISQKLGGGGSHVIFPNELPGFCNRKGKPCLKALSNVDPKTQEPPALQHMRAQRSMAADAISGYYLRRDQSSLLSPTLSPLF
jgi:hypothetical protein